MKLKNTKNPFEEFGQFPVTLTDNQQILFTNMRGKVFDIVTYLPLHYVLNILNSAKTMCENYILIKHDKADDLFDKETGLIGKDHIHIVFMSYARRRASRLVKLFNTTQIMRLENQNQLVGSVLYLTHSTENCIREGKVKYESERLITNNHNFFSKLSYVRHTQDNALEVIDRINFGLPYRDLVALYGRDFVFHYRQYADMALEIYKQEQLQEVKEIKGDLVNIDTGEIITF